MPNRPNSPRSSPPLLSEEDSQWLADLLRQPGWEVFRRLVDSLLYQPALGRLRQATDYSQAAKAQGELEMLDKLFRIAHDVLHSEGGIPE